MKSASTQKIDTPLNETQDEHPQERIAKVAYGELGKGSDIFETWGVANYKGEPRNLYWDREINREIFIDEILNRTDKSNPIKMADFGGAEGKLLREIFATLKENGLNVSGVTIDQGLKKGKTKEAWDSYKRERTGRNTPMLPLQSLVSTCTPDH